MRALSLVLLVACSSARPAADDPTGDAATGPTADAGVDASDSTSADAAPDAPPDAPEVVDTCMPPTGAFTTDLPPSPSSNTTRRRAALQVTAAGALRAFTSDLYQNGSFHDANVVQHARGATMWTQGSIANGGIGLSVGRYLATTDDCIAYSYDYDGTLHMRCSGAGDRTLAPSVRGALAIASDGTAEHLVYENGAGVLVYQQFDGDPQPAQPIHGGAWVYGPSSLAVDASGSLHVAYVVIEPPPSGSSVGSRTVRYAVRPAGTATWTSQTVDTDSWRYTSEEADTVSLVVVAGAPVIAYHHRSTRSMKLATHGASGFQLRTLLAPDPGFENDLVGQSLALAADCVGRLHVVYARNLTTDATPNLALAYAQITATGLEHRQFLAMTASTAYRFSATRHGLGFHVAADGKQYVAAQIGGIYGTALYVATR